MKTENCVHEDCSDSFNEIDFLNQNSNNSDRLKLYFYNKNDSSELSLEKKEFSLNPWLTVDSWFNEHFLNQKQNCGLTIKKKYAMVGSYVDDEVKIRTILVSYNSEDKSIELRINKYSDLYVELLKNDKVNIYLPLNASSSKISRVIQFFASLRETSKAQGFDNESYFESFNTTKLNLTERHREQYDGNSISNYYEIVNNVWTLSKTKKYYYTGFDAERIQTNFR